VELKIVVYKNLMLAGMTIVQRVKEIAATVTDRKRKCARSVRKVSSHCEYLEKRSRGLDITWQPVRGDLTAHPWTVTLSWG